MSQPYAAVELGILENRIGSAPLSELEALLGRPSTGIAQKLGKLSKKDPHKWSLEKVKPYVSEGMRITRNNPAYIIRGRERIQDFLAGNPHAVISDITEAGLEGALLMGYKGNLSSARAEAGINFRGHVGSPLLDYAVRRKRLLSFLKENPQAKGVGYGSWQDDLRKTFGNIHAARQIAGIVPDMYVCAARAAKYFRITKQAVYDLFTRHRIDGVKVGGNVYVSIESLQSHRKAHPR